MTERYCGIWNPSALENDIKKQAPIFLKQAPNRGLFLKQAPILGACFKQAAI
jgi:hypothetical protein